MADADPTGAGSRDPFIPAEQDEILERAVLVQVLVLHPAQLTIEELVTKMDADCEDFAQRDAVERAVWELTRDGLLRCDRRRVWPSHAALRFDALSGGS